MSTEQLEERIQALGREVAELKERLSPSPPQADRRRTIGLFRGDAVLREIVEAGQAMRRAEEPDE